MERKKECVNYQGCAKRQKKIENKAIIVGITKTNKLHPLDPSI